MLPEESVQARALKRPLKSAALRAYWSHDLERLRDRGRVWFIFSHVWFLLGTDERVLLFHLDRLGARRLDEISRKGAAAYLYEFTPAGRGTISASPPG